MIRKITTAFGEFGFATGLLYIFDRILTLAPGDMRVFAYDFFVQPLTRTPLLPPRRTRHVTIREIRAGDPALQLMPVPVSVIQARFRQSAICVGAFRRDELLGYIWFTFGRYAEDEIRCDYVLEEPDDSVFDFDVYVFPKYRMSLGFLTLWNGAIQYLQEDGKRYSFSRISRFNLMSLRAHVGLGAIRVLRCVVFKVGRFEIMIINRRPLMQLTLNPGKRMRLTLSFS